MIKTGKIIVERVLRYEGPKEKLDYQIQQNIVKDKVTFGLVSIEEISTRTFIEVRADKEVPDESDHKAEERSGQEQA